MAAAVAGSAGCLALAPVRLALGKADAPVEITFKIILGMKMAIRDEKEIQFNEAGFAVQKFSVQKPNLPNLNTPWPPFMLSGRTPSLTPMIRSGTSPTVRTLACTCLNWFLENAPCSCASLDGQKKDFNT